MVRDIGIVDSMATLQEAIRGLGTCLTGAQASKILHIYANKADEPSVISLFVTFNELDAKNALRRAGEKARILGNRLSSQEKICRGDQTGGAKSTDFNSIIYAISDIFAGLETLKDTESIMSSAVDEAIAVAQEKTKEYIVEPVSSIGAPALSLVQQILKWLPYLVLGAAIFLGLQAYKTVKAEV